MALSRKSLYLVLISVLFYLPGSLGMPLSSLTSLLSNLSGDWQTRPICGCTDESCCCGAPCCAPEVDTCCSQAGTDTLASEQSETTNQSESVTLALRAACTCGGSGTVAYVSPCDPHIVARYGGHLLAPRILTDNFTHLSSHNSNSISPLDKIPISLRLT